MKRGSGRPRAGNAPAPGQHAPAARRRPAPPRAALLPPLTPTHPAAVAAAIVAAGCVLLSVSFRLYDADTWEHLAVGRALWQAHVWPVVNRWTWPTFGAPNLNPSWGFSALLWPFWVAGGVPGLFVWRWLTTGAAFALAWLTARRLGARGLAPLLVLVVASLVYRQRSQVRPETLAAVWFALTLWILETRRAGGPDRTAWLPLVALAWANTHVSYYLLFALAALQLAFGPAAGRRRLAWMTLAALAAACVNPWGPRTLLQPFRFALTAGRDPLLSQIAELQPFSWALNLGNGLPLLIGGWPLLALRRGADGRRDRVELATCAAFTALAFVGSRFTATYALAAAPYVARDLDAWLAGRRAPRALRAPWARAAATGTLCVAAGAWAWTHVEPPPGIAFDMQRAPVHACDFVERAGVRGRALNHFFHGGYMLWRFGGARDRLPFVDIHPEDTPAPLRLAYLEGLNSPAGFRALDARWRFDWALLSRRYADAYGILDVLDAAPGWALVFVDDVAAVYVRRDGADSAAAAHAYRVLRGSRRGEGALVAACARDSSLRAAALDELDRQARDSPANFRGRALLRALAGR